MDKEKALILFLDNKDEQFITIKSDVENYQVKGGSRSKTSWGPQQVVKDSKYLEREKHQLKQFFKEIIDNVNDADSLVIYGSAETYLKFEKELKENYKEIAGKLKKVEKADSMTVNQVKAKIRNSF